MAVAFTQSMRALATDRGQGPLPVLCLVGVLLGGWGAWFVGARIAVYAVSQTARLDVDQAIHLIATPVAGRLVTTHLVVGREVQAGEVLAELDVEAPRLQYEEAHTQLMALETQRQARQQEIVAEQAAREQERQAARAALAEARARHQEGVIMAQAAGNHAAIYDHLDARGFCQLVDPAS